jgi:hypothetical protein
MKDIRKKDIIEDNLKKKIIIACYRRPYIKSSLELIEKLLEEEKIEKVYILSITEKKDIKENILSYLGTRDVRDFEDKLNEDQMIRAAKYTDEIISICKKLKINCEKITRRGKTSMIILDEAEKIKPSQIVIHKSDKSKIDKRLSGSVSDELCNDSMCIIKMFK